MLTSMKGESESILFILSIHEAANIHLQNPSVQQAKYIHHATGSHLEETLNIQH